MVLPSVPSTLRCPSAHYCLLGSVLASAKQTWQDEGRSWDMVLGGGEEQRVLRSSGKRDVTVDQQLPGEGFSVDRSAGRGMPVPETPRQGTSGRNPQPASNKTPPPQAANEFIVKSSTGMSFSHALALRMNTLPQGPALSLSHHLVF